MPNEPLQPTGTAMPAERERTALPASAEKGTCPELLANR